MVLSLQRQQKRQRLQKSEVSKDENRKHKNYEDRESEGEEVNVNNERLCHVMAMTFTKRDPTSMVRSSLLVYGAIILQRGRKKEDGRSEKKRSQIYSCMQEGCMKSKGDCLGIDACRVTPCLRLRVLR